MRIAESLLVVAVVAALPVGAQSPAFEVASVKVNHASDAQAGYPRLTNGRLSVEYVTLKTLLQVAYGLSALQISGPGWLDSDRFDVTAKSPDSVPDTALMPMLQSLLKERFQLTAHTENREMQVYDLIVAKEGLKISPFDPAHPPKTPPRNGAASMLMGPGTMSGLAGMLGGAAGRLVVNKTGLEGRYGYAVLFSPLAVQATGDAAGPGGLDIFAALQQQLGLKLEPNKEPIEILVVDHAERVPTEN